MTNNELIAALAERMGWSVEEVADVLSAFGSVVGSRLMEGDAIHLQGLGMFEAKKKMERVSVNPATGKRYLVPPKLVAVFKPGVTVKSKLKELNDNEQ